MTRLSRFPLLLFLLASLAAEPGRAQTAEAPAPPPTPDSVAKAEEIVRKSVEALGGARYLEIRTLTARGLFTPFQDGTTGVPSSFVDYLVYPDRERTEFRSGGVRTIQTNNGATGWIYDGAARSLRDMKPAQIENFRFAMRTSVEYLLRGWWREAKAQLSYVGRREAGLARRNETVRLTHADGLVVEYEFGAKDNLPAKVIYRKKNDQDEEITEEDRFAQFIAIGGVLTPFIIDHYRAGTQSSRINYESVEYNRSLPETLFQKPPDVKALK